MDILIADDDAAFSHVVSKVLSMEGGHRVTLCDSGEEAIEHLKSQTFDVILLDYKMPGISGLNVLQWLNEQKIDTPVVMLTAAGNETVAVETMKLGAYEYIRKEYLEIDHLPLIISGVYERYQFRKEKQLREQEEQERQKRIEVMKMFQDTVSSIGHLVNTALSVQTLSIDEYEKNLITLAPEQHRKQFAESYRSIKQEIGVVASGVKSLLSLSALAYKKFANSAPAPQEEEAFHRQMERLKAEVSKLNGDE